MSNVPIRNRAVVTLMACAEDRRICTFWVSSYDSIDKNHVEARHLPIYSFFFFSSPHSIPWKKTCYNEMTTDQLSSCVCIGCMYDSGHRWMRFQNYPCNFRTFTSERKTNCKSRLFVWIVRDSVQQEMLSQPRTCSDSHACAILSPNSIPRRFRIRGNQFATLLSRIFAEQHISICMTSSFAKIRRRREDEERMRERKNERT